ncbi:uncharacterized protein LOC132194421 [Neocloeon triangulifer]|uniref:uncharacterized protein LOC132194421 n=1 Tax=Neocloeon triangulifer TaxID=2078957 RepID=UPI00286F09B3|nr:uncharacterized protein LOC132194421 [Neocloeon triangulifer]
MKHRVVTSIFILAIFLNGVAPAESKKIGNSRKSPRIIIAKCCGKNSCFDVSEKGTSNSTKQRSTFQITTLTSVETNPESTTTAGLEQDTTEITTEPASENL